VDLNRVRPFTVSDASDPALETRMARDGYLYLPGLAPPQAVAAACAAVAGLLAHEGILQSGSAATDLVYRGGEPPSRDVLLALHKRLNPLAAFTELAEQPAILAVMRTLLGETARTHVRRICRVKYPHDPYDVVGPHQDFWYVKGAEDTYTCWLPLTATSAALGGLAILPGTHLDGTTAHSASDDSRFQGVGGIAPASEWAWSEMRAGDALVFHSLTVHGGLPNASTRVRISVDYRYQREGDAMEESHVRPHFE
jgi:ectoine hydroxylase-related dioxygenase (phytanoyl-CoA dioxygenase family)